MLRTVMTCLLFSSAALAAVPSEFEVFGALPDYPDQGLRVEGGVVFKDLRRQLAGSRHARARRMQSELGARYYAEPSGADWLEELGRIVDWAAPSGAAVPAGIVAFSRPFGLPVKRSTIQTWCARPPLRC